MKMLMFDNQHTPSVQALFLEPVARTRPNSLIRIDQTKCSFTPVQRVANTQHCTLPRKVKHSLNMERAGCEKRLASCLPLIFCRVHAMKGSV